MFNHWQKRLIIIAFFIGLNIVLGTYFLGLVRLEIPRPMAEVFYRLGISPNAATSVDEVVSPKFEEPDLEIAALVEKVNEYRQSNDVNPVKLDPELSAAAETLLKEAEENQYDTDINFASGALETALEDSGYVYERVSHNALVGPLTVDGVMTAWLSDQYEVETLINEEFTDIGLAVDIIDDPSNGQMGVVIQLLGKERVQSSSNRTNQAASTQSAPPPVREIPDDEVVAALNDYRSAHGRSPYNVNDHLCTYAEKRAQDLVAFGGLDGHQGFREDFDDPENPPVGIADYPPGRKIGENLAHQHCKNMSTGESFVAETGTALIEWCFDSSTMGHREAQLSTEFNNVCVRHADKMYVVIFGE